LLLFHVLRRRRMVLQVHVVRHQMVRDQRPGRLVVTLKTKSNGKFARYYKTELGVGKTIFVYSEYAGGNEGVFSLSRRRVAFGRLTFPGRKIKTLFSAFVPTQLYLVP